MPAFYSNLQVLPSVLKRVEGSFEAADSHLWALYAILAATTAIDFIIFGLGTTLLCYLNRYWDMGWVPSLALATAIGTLLLLCYCVKESASINQGISFNTWMGVLNPLVLSAAALWAAVASFQHVIDSGQRDCSSVPACLSSQNSYLQGLNTIVTVSKAVQTLSLSSTGSKVQAHVQSNVVGRAFANGAGSADARLLHMKKLW
ncbi:hypothetical protein WJX81_002669 [Elliptochloris bilobata]|uniref:Uncharacterized protein n=1 Tax=Elliptochloris bilobata TaxID=381761 RepID=A0AAW1S5R1_9CHLO